MGAFAMARKQTARDWRRLILLVFTLASPSVRGADAVGSPSDSSPADRVVYLQAKAPRTEHSRLYGNFLFRELPRQALLIAARDELGLATRDMVLRESPLVDGEAAFALDMETLGEVNEGPEADTLRVAIYESQGENRKQLLEERYALNPDRYEYYFPVIEAMEQAAREEFVAALREAGLEGEANTPSDHEVAPSSVELHLTRFEVVSQFAAVREAHRLMREAGESPGLLGALSRGYANLGLLSRHHWTASSKTFFARSLLYAERLVQRRPETPTALEHRAYARALVGLGAAALADLADATELSGADAGRPAWAKAAELYAQYDFQALANLSNQDASASELAAALSFLVLATGGGDANVIEAAYEATAAAPECYLLYDRLCDFLGVSNLHFATLQGPTAFQEYFPQRVRGLPDLPESVQAAARPPQEGWWGWKILGGGAAPTDPLAKAPAGIAAALAAAGDQSTDGGEPSLTVLGRLAEEEMFEQASRRIRFVRYSLGLPYPDIAQYLGTILPPVADHPYAPWLESHGVNPGQDPEAYRALLAKVQPGDLSSATQHFVRDAMAANVEIGDSANEAWAALIRGLDLTAPDTEWTLDLYGPNEKYSQDLALLMQRVAPRSPKIVCALALKEGSTAEELKTWEIELGDHTDVLASLAHRYRRDGKLVDAARCLQRWVEISPDQSAFELLAEIHKELGNDDRWLATLEAFLDQPDYGLGHASVQVQIAEYYMRQRKWKQALPYADAAAQTWAYWAMDCASRCYEAIGDWELSEAWISNAVSRYPDSGLAWYFWCRRTNHGDVASARARAKVLVEDLNSRQPAALQKDVAGYYLLEGDARGALTALSNDFQQTPSYWAGFHIVLIAMELDDAATRDEIMQVFANEGLPDPSAESYPYARFAEILRDAMAEDAAGDLDLVEFERLLDSAAEGPRCDLTYFTGRYLADRGDQDQALEYFRRSYNTSRVNLLNRTFAAAALAEGGVALAPVSDLEE